MTHSSLFDILSNNISSDKGITFITGYENQQFLSYPDLFKKAKIIASFLKEKKIGIKNELILQI
jgi:hypothetical protein